MENCVLVDVLRSELNIVFCGTAAGRKSAARGAYYAGPGNQFWPVLTEIGLVPCRLEPEEFRSLAKFNIGLTDIAKHASGADAHLKRHDFDVDGFKKRLLKFAPRVIAFNGKKAASLVLGCQTRSVMYGLQATKLGSAMLFVLPSTSAAARRYWNTQHWFDLAALLRSSGPA